MRMPTKTASHSPAEAKPRLDDFLDRFTPDLARSARGVLAAMRKLCPGAMELVYDNYNALAIGFASGERVRDVWFSIAIYPNWANLFFFKTLPLEDPHRLLKGAGSTTRHIVLKDGAGTLAEPGVAALIAQALDKAGHPFPGGRGRIVIKSVSSEQRTRRPS